MKHMKEGQIKVRKLGLNKVSNHTYHLLEKNKHGNKIKVACAREFLAFIWEALTYLENKERR